MRCYRRVQNEKDKSSMSVSILSPATWGKHREIEVGLKTRGSVRDFLSEVCLSGNVSSKREFERN